MSDMPGGPGRLTPVLLPRRPWIRAAVGLSFVAGLAGVALIAGIEHYVAMETVDGPEAAPLLEEWPIPVVPIEEPPAPPAGWDISNIDHPRVEFWIRRFQTDKRDKFEGFLKRKETRAYSRAHASGLWQFIRGTAARYGLDINRAVDERNDPVKATAAALRYLEDLHREFGSWYLAAAAYNTGERRIARIMRTTMGRVRGTDVDYYRIWNRLPAETRDYVPLMIAAARIAKDPERYGFRVDALEPWRFEQVVASPGTPLEVLARRAGTTVAAIRLLNPHLKLDRTRADRAMAVRVPARPSAPVPAALAQRPGTLVAD